MPVISIDAPIGGLNAFDSVDAMPPTDAVVLDNWIPRSGYVESRPGYRKYSTDLGGPVESLMTYKGVTGSELIAAANGQIWNVTSGLLPVSLISGMTNDRWQHFHINNLMVMCNGQDAPKSTDGTGISDLVLQLWDPDALGPGQGDFVPFPNPEDLIGGINFKGRAYYWRRQGQSFYYAEAGSFQNQMYEFPLTSVVQTGGYIQTMFTWTRDAGVGPDDVLGIIFSTGEILLYQGDDPGNVGFFEQIGRFEIPDPLGRRCTVKFGSDVIIITKNGYVNLTSVLKEDQVSDFPAFSRKISRLVYQAGREYGALFGHEAILTDYGYLTFNVPVSTEKSIQYVRNASTGAWARLIDVPAITWETFNDTPYFGSADGFVRVSGGFADDEEPIRLQAMAAFHYLDDAGVQKQITAAQVLTTFPEPKLIQIQGWGDFVLPTFTAVVAPGGATEETFWNEAIWNVDFWNRRGGLFTDTQKGWQNVHAFGYAVTVSVQMAIQSQNVIWRSTGIRYRMAGAQ
jgi:hypothetical protein